MSASYNNAQKIMNAQNIKVIRMLVFYTLILQPLKFVSTRVGLSWTSLTGHCGYFFQALRSFFLGIRHLSHPLQGHHKALPPLLFTPRDGIFPLLQLPHLLAKRTAKIPTGTKVLTCKNSQNTTVLLLTLFLGELFLSWGYKVVENK